MTYDLKLFVQCALILPMPVVARSKALVCGRSLAGSAGSNPAGCVDDCLLWVVCVVKYRSLRRDDHSSRGVLPTVVVKNQ